ATWHASGSATASRHRRTSASPVSSATSRRTRTHREGLLPAQFFRKFPGRFTRLRLGPPEPRPADGSSFPVVQHHVVAAVLAGEPDLTDDAGSILMHTLRLRATRI